MLACLNLNGVFALSTLLSAHLDCQDAVRGRHRLTIEEKQLIINMRLFQSAGQEI